MRTKATNFWTTWALVGVSALTLWAGCGSEGTKGKDEADGGASSARDAGGNSDAPGQEGKGTGFATPMTPAPFDKVTGARSAVLPVLWITAGGKVHQVPNDQKIAGRLKLVENPGADHANIDKATATLETTIGIGPRGSSSASFPQKAWGIEFQDDKGKGRKQAILDMSAGEDFALVPCWNEQTCMRNAVAYAMGRQFGQWNPRLRFVELYLEGSYHGLYQLIEVIRQGKERVAIPEPGDVPGSNDITGGYVFRREVKGPALGSGEWVGSVEYPTRPGQMDPYVPKSVWQYHVPNEYQITENQRTYLKNYMDAFETAMKGPDFADPQKGYRKWIDVKSFTEYFLIGEVTANVDWFFKSFYLTKDRDDHGGKLHLGPIWDFNYALGNSEGRDAFKTDIWIKDQSEKFGGECSQALPFRNANGRTCQLFNCFSDATRKDCQNQPYAPFWIEKLWADPGFQNEIKCRWNDLKKTAFNVTELHKRIDDWKAEIKPNALKRHFARWPTLVAKVSPNVYDPMTMDPDKFFDDHVAWLKDWMQKRITWLDANLPGTCR